jgi:hypothetical protein
MDPRITIKQLCIKFNERCDSQGIPLKSKNRDDKAMEFFVGACNALYITGQTEEANKVESFLTFGIQYRGYQAIRKELEAK